MLITMSFMLISANLLMYAHGMLQFLDNWKATFHLIGIRNLNIMMKSIAILFK